MLPALLVVAPPPPPEPLPLPPDAFTVTWTALDVVAQPLESVAPAE
jgi:hypothetical protein